MRPCGPTGGTSVVSVTEGFSLRDRSRTSAGGSTGRAGSGSDVEEPDVLRVALDELAATVDVLTHELGEEDVGESRVLEGHLQQDPLRRVHRRVPELVVVHLAETLVALHPV